MLVFFCVFLVWFVVFFFLGTVLKFKWVYCDVHTSLHFFMPQKAGFIFFCKAL